MSDAADAAEPEQDAIIIRGGLAPGEPTQATVGGKRLDRGPDETLADFEARALAAATAAGEPFVVIGGLPDDSEADARL